MIRQRRPWSACCSGRCPRFFGCGWWHFLTLCTSSPQPRSITGCAWGHQRNKNCGRIFRIPHQGKTVLGAELWWSAPWFLPLSGSGPHPSSMINGRHFVVAERFNNASGHRRHKLVGFANSLPASTCTSSVSLCQCGAHPLLLPAARAHMPRPASTKGNGSCLVRAPTIHPTDVRVTHSAPWTICQLLSWAADRTLDMFRNPKTSLPKEEGSENFWHSQALYAQKLPRTFVHAPPHLKVMLGRRTLK